jgi:hypothetical protein
MLNVIGQPQPLLSKLLEKFSDNSVPIGLGQLQTPLLSLPKIISGRIGDVARPGWE